ncbi:MAG: HEAT repeat domain-containing protein [Oligoflexales bacterium]
MEFGFQDKKESGHSTKPGSPVVDVDIGGSDFWDLGAGDHPELQGFPAEKKQNSRSFMASVTRVLALGLAMAFVSFAAAVIFDDSILDMISTVVMDTNASVIKKQPFKAAARGLISPSVGSESINKDHSEPPDGTSFAQAVVIKKSENPYWDLDNSTRVVDTDKPVWTEVEEVVWSRDLRSENPWHRYRVAVEVARYQLKGSERILWRLLQDSQLWVRMRALSGLGDFGVPLSIGVIHKVLQKARTDRLWRFLKRYMEVSTPGERYIMRGMIRFVGAKARFVILRSLANHRDAWTASYLKAALHDSDPRILAWTQRLQRSSPWLFQEYRRPKAKEVRVQNSKEELNYEKKLDGGFDEEAWREWDALYR